MSSNEQNFDESNSSTVREIEIHPKKKGSIGIANLEPKDDPTESITNEEIQFDISDIDNTVLNSNNNNNNNNNNSNNCNNNNNNNNNNNLDHYHDHYDNNSDNDNDSQEIEESNVLNDVSMQHDLYINDDYSSDGDYDEDVYNDDSLSIDNPLIISQNFDNGITRGDDGMSSYTYMTNGSNHLSDYSDSDNDDPNSLSHYALFDRARYNNYSINSQNQLRMCLEKNLQYQAWIKHQLQLIEYVEMKLKEDQEKLANLTKNATKGTRAQAKNMLTLRKFFPYFRDQNGMVPPCSKEPIKNEAHMHGLYDKPASKWTEKERKDLAKGVRLQNLEMLCRPMFLELENCSDQRAKTLRRQIDQIKRKPDHELELNLDGIEWDKLAIDMLPHRHAMECKLQWIQIDHPSVSRKPWTKSEDKCLLQIAKKRKERDWNAIAMELKSHRTPVQCLQRYQTALNTEHVKREWSQEDDEKLRDAVVRCGVGNWQEVANYMGNSHTGAQCLNRWDKTIKPTFRKGKWTDAEDDLLKKGVDIFGVGNWKKIASIVTSRTDVQCRERWVNILDPTIDHGKWTREEDEILLQFVSKFGPGKWSQLASVMGSRTDNMVMRRWEKLNKPGVVAKYRLLRLKAKFARGADSKVKATLEPEDLDVSILPEKARDKVRKIKRSAGKIRRHSSRTAYDCPYEKDRPYAKPNRPIKKYATLGRPRGSKSRLIFRESDTDVLGSDISILEGEVVQFTDGKIPIKKNKIRRKRKKNEENDLSSDSDNAEVDKTRPKKKRLRRSDELTEHFNMDGSDADISGSDEDTPYKRSFLYPPFPPFLSFIPNRHDHADLFGSSVTPLDFQTIQSKSNFPVIPHKTKGKQRGRPRETFWDKTFPSFQESQIISKSIISNDDSLLF